MDRERLERQFDFIKEIDKEKFIQRQTKLSDGVRRKTMQSMPGIWRS